jgi:hypothetical protein
LWYAKDALGWLELPPELVQAVEGFLEVGDELIAVSSLDDHVIHVSFNIAVQLISEAELDGSLICGSCVLQPEGHSFVGVCSKRGDERCLDLVFFLEGNLMVARVAVKEVGHNQPLSRLLG